MRRAPEGWLEQHPEQPPPHVRAVLQESAQPSVSTRESRSAWARLLAKAYEVDALRCSRCGSPKKVLAFITNPQ